VRGGERLLRARSTSPTPTGHHSKLSRGAWAMPRSS
jgi:hypothetical protein